MTTENPVVAILNPVGAGFGVARAAKKRGFTLLFFLDSQSSAEVPADLREDALTVRTDVYSVENLLEKITELVLAARIVAVIPGVEYSVKEANLINHRLGLPGLDPKCLDLVRSKVQMREALEKAGIAIPRFWKLDTLGELKSLVGEIRFPCVVKPIDAGASIGVVRVSDESKLYDAVSYSISVVDPACGMRFSRGVIIEEYIVGPEYSVEGYVDDGVVKFVGITEKKIWGEDCFVEWQAHCAGTRGAFASEENLRLLRDSSRSLDGEPRALSCRGPNFFWGRGLFDGIGRAACR